MSKNREFWVEEDENEMLTVSRHKPSFGRLYFVREVSPERDQVFAEMLEALKHVADYVDSGGFNNGVTAEAKDLLAKYLYKSITRAEELK